MNKTWDVMDGSGRKQGEIIHVAKGCCNLDALLDIDTFRLTFENPGMPADHRYLWLASAILLDFEYFEGKDDKETKPTRSQHKR